MAISSTGSTDSAGSTEVALRCATRLPCRAGASLDVPVSSSLVVEAVDNDVLVDTYNGDLSIESLGAGNVSAGPVAGRLRINAEDGAVFGAGLTAGQVEVTAGTGQVELWFAARPQQVIINAGSEPVAIKLPDGDYAVSVQGASSAVVAVGTAATADSQILVQASGPVRIEPTE